MEIKTFILLLLGLLVLGLIIIAIYRATVPFAGIAPSGEEVALNSFYSLCDSRLRMYKQSPSISALNELCCTNSDLDGSGAIESNEYCSNANLESRQLCYNYVNGALNC